MKTINAVRASVIGQNVGLQEGTDWHVLGKVESISIEKDTLTLVIRNIPRLTFPVEQKPIENPSAYNKGPLSDSERSIIFYTLKNLGLSQLNFTMELKKVVPRGASRPYVNTVLKGHTGKTNEVGSRFRKTFELLLGTQALSHDQIARLIDWLATQVPEVKTNPQAIPVLEILKNSGHPVK